MPKGKLTPNTIRRRLAASYAEAEKAEADHRLRIQDLQSRCPHKWEYQPDPAGGSDSGYFCYICNLWRKRID